MKPRSSKAIILTLLAALMLLPQLGETCGPFFDEAVFVREHGPDAPMADFAKGRLGVLQPEWHTAYQVVAFRYLEGKPLSAEEQRSLLDHYDTERRIEPPDTTLQAMDAWVAARSLYLPAAPPGSDLSVFKQSLSTFYEIPNCLAPAFNMAVTTLQDRARRFGSSSPELQEWIRGQDAVFRNCRGAETIPPEVPATANPLLRADRAYQIAAARFYASPSPAGGAGDGYETTLHDFQAIAADPTSPWHNLASYLVARTLIREASATASPNQTYNPTLLTRAETQLQSSSRSMTTPSRCWDWWSIAFILTNARLSSPRRWPRGRASTLGRTWSTTIGCGAAFPNPRKTN